LLKEEISELHKISQNLRVHMVEMVFRSKSGHLGGSFSCIDIMLYIYKKLMMLTGENKDTFILSKGHSAPALYSVLEEMGFLNKEDLLQFRTNGGRLKGHPSRLSTKGVEVGVGSLGMGLSVGIGEALSNRLEGADSKVYVLLGDGELDEGQIWEAFMSAGHFKLNNLVAIIDKNGIQLDGKTEDVMKNEQLDDKIRSFNWEVRTIDGHNFDEMDQAFSYNGDKPLAIIAHTIKGKGVSYMENTSQWHSFRIHSEIEEHYENALSELRG